MANPNWFNVDFKEITADVTYPGTSANFGSGSLKNVNFAGHTSSTFDFPLDLQYSTDIDPNRIILSDLISESLFSFTCPPSSERMTDIILAYPIQPAQCQQSSVLIV